MKYDVVVVGAGPAGLTAAIYTARRTLNTLILAKDLGGQMAATSDIENYPGFDHINGVALAMKMKAQAETFGAVFKMGDVTKIEKQEDHFVVSYNNNELVETDAVILAFGLTPRNLDVPGEQEFKQRGVTYCANCDAPLYRNKVVAVVGGGNSALDAADYLSKIATQVYLIHRRDKFRGEEVLIQGILNNSKIKIIYDAIVTEIKGERVVKSMSVQNIKTNKVEDIAVDGMFIEVGRIAKTDFVEKLVQLNDKREVEVDYNGLTKTAGVFACGDVTNVNIKQIAIASGEGVKAALACYTYLLKKRGQTIVGVDWGKRK